MLALLAEQPERVVSRRELMQHLWASEHVGDEHACEVHISNLRRKIERDPSQPERLVTVRGLGLQARPGVSCCFGARYPIVQAPMANVQPPSLAAAVSNAGALGTIAGRGAVGGRAARGDPRGARRDRSAPFGVNLFAPPYLREDALEVVLEERPAVFSFTFGLVDPEPLQERGIAVLGHGDDGRGGGVPRERGRRRGRRAGRRGGRPSRHVPRLVRGRARAARRARSRRSTSARAGASPRAGSSTAPAIARGARARRGGRRRSARRSSSRPSAARPREHLDALRTLRHGRHPAYTGRHMRAARTPVLEELMHEPTPLPFPRAARGVGKARPALHGRHRRAARARATIAIVGRSSHELSARVSG